MSGSRVIARSHGRLVHERRVRVLAGAIAPLIERGWSVLDVGCGDGRLSALIAERAGCTLRGCDVLVRPDARVPVEPFDGHTLPAADASVDAVVFADVLHHADDPMALLGEARRVARHAVVIKDHRLSRPLARPVLRVMDWVGNAAHGVALPYNYWPERRWRDAWACLGLRTDRYVTRLGLYPWPANWAFEVGLHFVARLVPEAS